MRNPSIALPSKTLALVMLRRLISTSVEENWSGLDEQIKSTLKVELLNAVQQEADQSIRKKITDVIAELARFLIGINVVNLFIPYYSYLIFFKLCF
jgi:importin-5